MLASLRRSTMELLGPSITTFRSVAEQEEVESHQLPLYTGGRLMLRSQECRDGYGETVPGEH